MEGESILDKDGNIPQEMERPNIYAELLLHLSSVSALVSLPSKSNRGTQASISSGGDFMSLLHEGLVTQIRLPASVPTTTSPITFPLDTIEVPFRFPMAKNCKNAGTKDASILDYVPWPASFMTPSTFIACQLCKDLIVKRSPIVWKDLPNANWAEMMDFWHCHKPKAEESAANGTNEVSKRVGVAGTFNPSAGIGLVDVLYFHLRDDACNVSQTRHDLEDKVRTLFTCGQ